MRFKVGDKVRVVNAPLGLPEGDMVGEIHKVTMVDNNKIPYELSNRYWCREDDLEPIGDTLVNKIIERNNKHTGGLTGDKVNSPSHYNRGEIEVIDIIKQLTQGYEPFEAYLVGNTIKYLARANYKENKQQDLKKAEWHINKLLEEEE